MSPELWPLLEEAPSLADAFLTMAPTSGQSVATAAPAASASASTPSEEYLETLTLYYEEEVEGEAYFKAISEQSHLTADQAQKMYLMGEVEKKAAEVSALRPSLALFYWALCATELGFLTHSRFNRNLGSPWRPC